MYKIWSLIGFLSLIFVSCSKDEPGPDVFMQIASITDKDGSVGRQISYDSYGRVIGYKCSYPNESVVAEYEYVSDDLVKISTEDIIFGGKGAYDIVRTYHDELHLENGHAVSCDGIFSQREQDETPFEKKYRHEFNYTSDNLLNTVKWTEWNKVGEEWAEDKPWSWENFYYWDNGNLVKIEDFFGHTYPCITYTFGYADFAGIQNVVPIPMGLYQYIPLQFKGVFGPQPASLISEIHRADTFNGNFSTSYVYEIAEGRITNYQESRSNGVSETFSVQWTK